MTKDYKNGAVKNGKKIVVLDDIKPRNIRFLLDLIRIHRYHSSKNGRSNFTKMIDSGFKTKSELESEFFINNPITRITFPLDGKSISIMPKLSVIATSSIRYRMYVQVSTRGVVKKSNISIISNIIKKYS